MEEEPGTPCTPHSKDTRGSKRCPTLTSEASTARMSARTTSNPDFKEWHEENHAAVSTCLRPLINLDLVCREVSLPRCEDTASTFEHVKAFVDVAPCPASEGLMDETAVRSVLAEVFQAEEAMMTEGPTDDELELLLAFVPTDEPMAEAEVRSKATLAATLWYLSTAHRTEWLTRVQLPLRKVPLMNALSHINNKELVQASEAIWLQEKFVSLPCNEELEVTKLLLCVACWYSKLPMPPGSLNRSLLLQRIELEKHVYAGFRFFFHWVVIFALLAYALSLTNKIGEYRGIRENVETYLKLSETKDVTSKAGIHTFAKAFSERIAAFAPLSNVYFPADHSWLVQDASQVFSNSTALPHEMEPDPNPENAAPSSFFIGRSFTMQAWVKVSPFHAFEANMGLSLLTKSLAVDDSLSCWSWRFPLQLRYGAHDYGPLEPNNITGTYEECIKMDYNMTRELSDEVVLHTLLVNETHVTFMVDADVRGSVVLPRAVTDCESTDIKMGDAGLTLASVKFYPRELTTQEVSQIFYTGLTWQEIGRMVHPQRMKASKEVLTSWHQDYLADRAASSQARDIASSLTALKQTELARSMTPYSNNLHQIVEGTDPVLNDSMWSIFTEPVYTSSESKVTAPGMSIPQPEGDGGFTFSSWVKVGTRGYLASLAMPMPEAGKKQWRGWANLCWAVQVTDHYASIFAALATGEETAETEQHRYRYRTSRNAKEDWNLKGRAYRHFVFSIDPANLSLPFRICIDGNCSSNDTFVNTSSGPPAANCMQTGFAQSLNATQRERMRNQTRLYLASRPEYDWRFTGWQMQTKLFNRVLGDEEVYQLFMEERSSPESLPIRQEHGCMLYEEAYDDHSWRDALGNDCRWYRHARRLSPAACQSDEVTRKCPMACGLLDLCWGEGPPRHESFSIWNRQLFFQSKGKYGTMCVASSTTPEEEAVACAVQSNVFCDHLINNRSELITCLGNTSSKFRGEPTFPCSQIVELASPNCTWDDSRMPFLQNASDGEFSLSFWFESADDRGCLQPNIRFLNSKGTVFRVGAEKDGEDEVNEAIGQWRTGCRLDENLLYFRALNNSDAEVEPIEANRGEKHLVVLGVSNKEAEGRRLHLILDNSENTEALNEGPEWNLKVINVQGNVVRSPLQVRAAMLRRTELSELLYSGEKQAKRVRPVMPLKKQLTRKSTRPVKAYTQTTRLVVPPFMLLQRQGADCKPKSNDLDSTFQDLGAEIHCQHPYECPALRLATQCASGDPDAKYFGQKSLHFSGKSYYMEFLTTLTSSTVLVRENDTDGSKREMRDTDQFVDSSTNWASIVAFFYSDSGILTRLRIDFNTKGYRVDAEFKFEHAASTTTEVMRKICALNGLCALFLFIIIGKSLRNLRNLKRKHLAEPELLKRQASVTHQKNVLRKRKFGLEMIDDGLEMMEVGFGSIINRTSRALFRRKHWFYGRAWGHLADLILAIFCLVACLVQVLFIWTSHRVINDTLEPMVKYWDSAGKQAATEEGIVKEFIIDHVAKFENSMFQSDVVGSHILAAVCICVMVRVVQTTSDHPRIDLITRTLELARSEFMHWSFLWLLVLIGFAILGTLLFGDKREEFSSVLKSVFTLLDSILGPPGHLSATFDSSFQIETAVNVVYVILFFAFCWLLLLNFILAIIVDNYAVVVEENAQCTVEQSLPEDLYDTLRYKCLQWCYRFPSKSTIVNYLSWRKLQTVDLEELFDSNLFHDQDCAEIWFYNYSRYNFLHAGSDQGVTSQQALERTAALMMQKLDVLLERKHASRQSRSPGAGNALQNSHGGSVRAAT